MRQAVWWLQRAGWVFFLLLFWGIDSKEALAQKGRGAPQGGGHATGKKKPSMAESVWQRGPLTSSVVGDVALPVSPSFSVVSGRVSLPAPRDILHQLLAISSTLQEVQGSKIQWPQKQSDAQLSKRVLGLARSFVGVREASGRNDGRPSLLFSAGEREPWCANFVKTVFMLAGLRLPGSWRDLTNARQMYRELRRVLPFLRRWRHRPQRGDLVFFAERKRPGRVSHVGLVWEVKEKRVFTIEGNFLNQVAQPSWGYNIRSGYASHKRKRRKIMGYIRWVRAREMMELPSWLWQGWHRHRRRALTYAWQWRQFYQHYRQKRAALYRVYKEGLRQNRQRYRQQRQDLRQWLRQEKKAVPEGYRQRLARVSEGYQRKLKKLRRWLRRRRRKASKAKRRRLYRSYRRARRRFWRQRRRARYRARRWRRRQPWLLRRRYRRKRRLLYRAYRRKKIRLVWRLRRNKRRAWRLYRRQRRAVRRLYRREKRRLARYQQSLTWRVKKKKRAWLAKQKLAPSSSQ